MIRKIERAWFEVWGSEQAQNRILKGLLTLVIFLAIAESLGLIVLALRGPVLITLSPLETKAYLPTLPTSDLTEAEVRRAIQNYIELRHSWEWAKIESNLRLAANYVDPSAIKKFSSQTNPEVKLAKERKVSQKLYLDLKATHIDMKSQKVRVSGDRILIVEGLRATNAQSFELTFSFGPRTTANPEGVYITAESLLSSPSSEKLDGGKRDN